MDNLTAEDRIRTMRAVKGKKTGIERSVAAMLVRRGLRGWKYQPGGVTGKPDFAFVERKIAIFVNGCFWHGCTVCNRPMPTSNVEYWTKKIARNVARDRKYREELKAEGWKVVDIWEHEIKNRTTDLTDLADFRKSAKSA